MQHKKHLVIFAARVIDIGVSLIFVSHSWPKLRFLCLFFQIFHRKHGTVTHATSTPFFQYLHF